jgi:hypothetical protein
VDSHNGKSYRPVPGKIPGTAINLGGTEWILAPLNLNQVEQFGDRIAALGSKSTLKENLADAAELVHASLSRNYSDITVEDVREMLDLGNFEKAAKAVVSISGYKAAQPGEAPPASQ